MLVGYCHIYYKIDWLQIKAELKLQVLTVELNFQRRGTVRYNAISSL